MEVLVLGDPRLREACAVVGDVSDPDFRTQRDRLVATLAAFRRRHGFGRAVAAPQIGVPRRFIALHLHGGTPFVIADPTITWRSEATFTLWDDCMSFPDLLVKVRRHDSISIELTDERGERGRWDRLDRPLAELLQHEIDHLDGVLAVDRAVEPGAFVARRVYEGARARFDAEVDYRIEPTLPPG
jgi:peptide deformylase